MKHIVYKITNKNDRKIYIGYHKTNDIHDSYMGSGTYLKRAIEDEGVDNFEKEILFVFSTAKDAFEKEAELVDTAFTQREDTYNIALGGHGGWDYVNSRPDQFLTEKRLSSLMTNAERTIRWKRKYRTDIRFKQKMDSAIRKAGKVSMKNNPEGTFKGRKHTEEAKAAIGKANSAHQIGKGNSQHGTCWVSHIELQHTIKIHKDYLPDFLEKGYIEKRVCDWAKYTSIITCKKCGKEFIRESSKRVYCSGKCRYSKSGKSKADLFCERTEDMVNLYVQGMSVSKAIEEVGLVRSGTESKKLKSILVSRGIYNKK